jgi:hypothetical protein
MAAWTVVYADCFIGSQGDNVGVGRCIVLFRLHVTLLYSGIQTRRRVSVGCATARIFTCLELDKSASVILYYCCFLSFSRAFHGFIPFVGGIKAFQAADYSVSGKFTAHLKMENQRSIRQVRHRQDRDLF